MADRPLSDIEVHDLLHEAVLLLSGKVVRTENGRQVLGAALRDLDILQKALLIMTEGSDPLSFQTAREP
jgi:hypothetical protein